MPVIYRPARTEDLQRAGELVVHSLNELCERHGFAPIATVRPPTFSQFSLRDDPNGLWVAEEADQIRGFAFSWVAGELWFLAQLFVSPGQQARGIGRQLLKRAFEHAIKAKTAVKALITPAFNSVSQGLYIQHGLFPRFPIYSISAEREELIKRLSGETLHCEPLENNPYHLDYLAKIDACALGIPRAKHHRFLINDAASPGVLLYAADECVGYAYVAEGHIGPFGGYEENRTGRRIQGRTQTRIQLRLSTRHGACPRSVQSGPDRSPRTSDAHHIPDAADVDK